MFAIKLHSNSLKRVKITKTVDVCIMLYPNQTSVEKSTTRKERVNTAALYNTSIMIMIKKQQNQPQVT